MSSLLFFILVRPQMAENIGMSARAMMNCGIDNLRIVNPRENPKSQEALRASSGAEAILKSAQIFSSLAECTSDLNYVLASTARFRDMEKPVFDGEKAILQIMNHLQNNEKVGVLFGPERTGLENDEVAISDGIIKIPLNPVHTSLNLSQAVLLVGYECLNGLKLVKPNPLLTNQQPATKDELFRFFAKLENILESKSYFKIPDKKPRMQRNLENIFAKTSLTSQEIRTLHGVVNTLSRPSKK